ncbi:MAG TPA: hypothetical protein VN977_04190, partial [Candidatus Binatia bacterium]|nr:hypothetical protein [Candidatus Binatia bacterium]
MLRRAMADRAAQQRVLAQVDPADLVGLASALIRIPSFKTEETPVARFLAPFFRERDYRVELQEVEPGRLYVERRCAFRPGHPD